MSALYRREKPGRRQTPRGAERRRARAFELGDRGGSADRRTRGLTTALRGILARRAWGIAFALAALFVVGQPRSVAAATTFVDRRVSAIPVATLLSARGSALVDPRRQRASVRLRRSTRPLFFAGALSQILALFFLWASGRGARLRDALRRAIRPVFAMRFAFGAALVTIVMLAALPVSLLRYRVEFTYGITNEHFLGWVRDGVVATVVDALVLGVIVACVFALVDRTRIWYLWAMAGLSAITLAMGFLEPVVVAPLYNAFAPLAATSPVRAPLLVLARRAGIGDAPIVVADDSRRTEAAVADIAGFGPTKRIVLSDALLANATTGEVLFLAARELGHYAHGDDFRLSLFWTFLLMLCTALAVVIADRVAFRRDDDPLARLSIVFALMGVLGLLATPIYNSYSRNLESRADSYALALTRNPASAVRAYVRLADETLAPLCPSQLSRIYFYNSPPLGTRIARAAGKTNPCP